MNGQENLEKTSEVRKKSGNLKIMAMAVFKKIIYSVHWGKDVLSH